MRRSRLWTGMVLGALLGNAGATPLVLEVDSSTGKGVVPELPESRPLAAGNVREHLALDLDGDLDLEPGVDPVVLFHTVSLEPDDPWELMAGYDGNGDGQVGPEDPAYQRLVLWMDTDGDGVVRGEELRSPQDLGVVAVVLPTEPGREGQVKTKAGTSERAGLTSF